MKAKKEPTIKINVFEQDLLKIALQGMLAHECTTGFYVEGAGQDAARAVDGLLEAYRELKLEKTGEGRK